MDGLAAIFLSLVMLWHSAARSDINTPAKVDLRPTFQSYWTHAMAIAEIRGLIK